MQLVDRWQGVQIGELRSLLLSKDVDGPFGNTPEGLSDFRGVSIASSLHQLTIEEVDFSNSVMDSGQIAAVSRRCRFTKCRFESNLGNDFFECDFRSSNLSNCVFRGRFTKCNFESANLVGTRGNSVLFENCNFSRANFRKASFVNSKFTDCKIVDCKFGSGSLVGSRFEGCEIQYVDFTNTVMSRVSGIAAS